jgi:hypothetical protein
MGGGLIFVNKEKFIDKNEILAICGKIDNGN